MTSTEKRKSPKILIYTWLVIAIISGSTAIHAFVKQGFSKDFLIFYCHSLSCINYVLVKKEKLVDIKYFY